MINGARSGTHFFLDPREENRVGRGTDCHIILSDPLCSRVHCTVEKRDGGWWIKDAQSRNGTYVNNQKIDEAQLQAGATVRVGTAEFEFQESAARPSNSGKVDLNLTQTIVRDAPMKPLDPFHGGFLRDGEQAADLFIMHQLTIRLLGTVDPAEVVRISLDLLRDRSQASVASFLWMTDEGLLKLKEVLPPEDADKIDISEQLTEMVLKKRHAVWVNNQRTMDESRMSGHYADAICVPLIREKELLGAVHLYRDRGEFRQADFEFAISAANIFSIALVRAREQAKLRADHDRLATKSADVSELIGESKQMRELKSRISRIAQATGCVLVRGESGAGKELVARALHRASPRADRPLLSVNCAAIPKDLMESQLFGHKKGAFTGAERDHAGWFQQADSGTLFLDEVGEMTLDGQAKLLRILEGYPFMPVGSSKEISVDVRVIAATNRDLQEFVRDGRFRQDLYYRLSVFELYIPPLRDRGADLETLLDHFLEHFRRHHGRTNLEMSPEARKKLKEYHWPGNVRQLRNVIDSAVVMAEGPMIRPEDLGLRDIGGGERIESLRMDVWERKLIQEALGRSDGNIPEAAKLLGIGRATLYRKIEEYGIQR